MCRCPIVVFIYSSRCFLMIFYVRPGQVFRKHFLIALRRLAVVGMKSAARRYCTSYDLVVWDRMLFATTSDCFVSRRTSHIPFCLFLVTFIISCPFLWNEISFLSRVCWCIHNKIRPPMILVGLFSFWGKYESD